MSYKIRIEDDHASMYKLVWVIYRSSTGSVSVLSPERQWVPVQPGQEVTEQPTLRLNMDWAKDLAEAILVDEPLGQEKLLHQRLNIETERVDKFLDHLLRDLS